MINVGPSKQNCKGQKNCAEKYYFIHILLMIKRFKIIMIEVSGEIVKKVYPKKDPWSHKGDYGKLLIISGSYRITGAPALVAMAALRSGLDTVYLAGPKR